MSLLAPIRYLSGLSKKLVFDPVGPTASKLWSLKVRSQKKLNNDVSAFPRRNLYCSKSLLSGRPGFDSQPAQSLSTHSYEAP